MTQEIGARSFQVDLHGIVDLLSNHLYSTREVFVRELLQNAVDAVAARRAREANYVGAVSVNLIGSGDAATIVVEDDGIGLSEDEVHQFLATIGSSSKRLADASVTQRLIDNGREHLELPSGALPIPSVDGYSTVRAIHSFLDSDARKLAAAFDKAQWKLGV